MKSKNPYRKKSRLGIHKTREIIKYFSEDLNASSTSKITWIERKTINDWYNYLEK